MEEDKNLNKIMEVVEEEKPIRKSKCWIVVLVTVLIVAISIIGYIVVDRNDGDDNCNEEVTESVTEKLESASFLYEDNYYVRNVVQDEGTYREVLDTEANNFMRILNVDSDKEVFDYNYITDTFSYLYYFEDELIMRVVYDYVMGEVLLDEAEQYDNLITDINTLKLYFEDLLEEIIIRNFLFFSIKLNKPY